MNKVSLLALVSLCGLCGCWPSPFLVDPPKIEQTSSASWSRPAPLITATQVTTENAHHLSQALWDEMDRQARQEPVGGSAAAAPPCKH